MCEICTHTYTQILLGHYVYLNNRYISVLSSTLWWYSVSSFWHTVPGKQFLPFCSVWVYLPISSTHSEEPSNILPKCVRRAEEDSWRKDSVLPAGIKVLKSPLRWVQNWSACMVIYPVGLHLSFRLFLVECWMNGESRLSRKNNNKKEHLRPSSYFKKPRTARHVCTCVKLAKAYGQFECKIM